MRVAYLPFDVKMASTRYRQIIPGRELQGMGFTVVDMPDAADVAIFTKHGWDERLLAHYPKSVFDICDDHFADKHGDFYRRICVKADALTCNSEAMRFRIFQETGRVASVIADPYELEEAAPSWGEGLLWFGHHSNLKDLNRELPSLKGYKVTVITGGNTPDAIPYSKESLLRELERCAVVILPTGKSPCKSANRMIEAIRRGKCVVANPLPAYEFFSRDIFMGNLREGVDKAHAAREAMFPWIRGAQANVARFFSPEHIGREWRTIVLSLVEQRLAA